MLKHRLLMLPLLVLMAGATWAADPAAPMSEKDRLSYSIGASIGKNLVREESDVDIDVLVDALRATVAGQKLRLPEKEIRQVMNDYEGRLRKQSAVRRQKAANENRMKGDAFLADYRKQPGVQTSPGGVLYQVLHEGAGRKPAETDTVVVNYRGTLVDGTQFDATEAGHPASLKMMSLITGWKQALNMMGVGAKWHLVIPPELGYGERGAGLDIGPNEVLVFDVELVDIK